jgi:Zn-dependent protease with chaperone function
MVARRCHDAGVPLVKLGIVDDGVPNAFTFGRTPSDARMWLTRGLIERLDHDEVDAVIAHEVGHIKHWDFAVMTIAAVIPMVLYLAYIVARGANRSEARAVAIGAYIGYIVSQFLVLALSRAREYAADHWSCECTGNGDALASALVKIAYGMGQADAERKEHAHALISQGKEGKKEAARLQSRWNRGQSMRAMGIFEPRNAEALQAVFAQGIDPERAVAAMRWDIVNPWGRALELMSSHPLVAHRIGALEEARLPGSPRVWSVLRPLASVNAAERMRLRERFAREVAVMIGPWVVLALVGLFGLFRGSPLTLGVALIAAGGVLLLKQSWRYPKSFERVEELTSLLERVDANPVTGIPVEVHGHLIGRGFPGYVLSPDLVLQDKSGFVPLVYKQPLPLVGALFGLLRAGSFIGEEVVARGWYRRAPGPLVELRDFETASGRRVRTWEWIARWIGSAVVVAIGALVVLASMAGG